MNNSQKKINLDRRSFLIGATGIGVAAMTSSLSFLTGCTAEEEPKKDAPAEKPVEAIGGDYDIIIVGAGGAGMTAALSAQEAGANVVILEKRGRAGGNTQFAEGGMNASETALQKEEGIEDSNELFASDTFEGGHELGNMELINYMCSNSNAAIERLADRGMYLTKISTSGGASVPRIHRPEDGSAVGAYLVEHLTELCEERGIELLTEMDVQEILLDDDGKVAGVKVVSDETEGQFNASAVIIATGGFGANHEKLAEYRPELLEAVTTNIESAQGDGIEMAEAIGADTVDMEQIQVHPTVEQNTSLLLSEGIRGDGAVLINDDGNRFTNELLTRDKVSAAEWEQPGGYAYAVFDHKVYEDNKSIEEKFVAQDLILIADTLEELGQLMEVDATNFQASMEAYNGAIEADTAAAGGEYVEDENASSDPHGRWKSRYLINEAPFYAVKVAPGIHHTMGGLKIDVETQVLDTAGEPIYGLFAAGEVTGGVHGGNRLGGNAMCDINVFGHHAAEGALKYVGIA